VNAGGEIHWLDALGQAELVRAGEVTPLELVIWRSNGLNDSIQY
jgi:hypothetical protein